MTAYQDVSETLQGAYAEQKESIQADIRNILEEENLVLERIKKSAFLPKKNEELEAAISSDWKNQVKQKEEELQSEKDRRNRAIDILNQMKYDKEIELYFPCELKVCSTKKPWNPTVPLALPVAPELSALCVIRPPALKGGKNIFGNNA